jgi:signal recognition particle receptor subunit beta
VAQLLFAKKQINVKIAYYGPGLAGKATSLEAIQKGAPGTVGGIDAVTLDGQELVRLDYFPDWLEPIRERTVCLQLFSVPGAVFWDTFPHRGVLQGADAVVFVADSRAESLEKNVEVWRRLGVTLEEFGESSADLPVVFQWNKRDLEEAVPVERLQDALNTRGAPAHESVAVTGTGVLEALQAAARLAVRGLEALGD